MIKKLFEPFHTVNVKTVYYVLILQILAILGFFQLYHSDIIPAPLTIFSTLITLLSSGELYDNLFRSFCLITYGMGLAAIVALLLSYLSQLLFFRKLIEIICSFRYLTLTGLTAIFTLLSKDTDSLRTNLLLFAIIPFFTTSMLDVINKTVSQDIELCYTLKKNRWWILKEVIIIGKLDQVFEVLRTNFAICWIVIANVESLAFNLGGIGTLLVKANKYVDLSMIFSLLIIILLLGLLADYSLGYFKKKLFPYSNISTI